MPFSCRTGSDSPAVGRPNRQRPEVDLERGQVMGLKPGQVMDFSGEYDKYVRYRTNLRKSVEILRVHPMPIYWYGPGDKPPPTTAARPGDNSPTIIDTPGQNLFIGMIVYLHGLLWTALSLTSWGHATLHHLWVCILLEERGDSTMWDTGAQSMWNRMNNMVLTAGLLLATAAVFATTNPPRDGSKSMLDWTVRGPYICILGSLGLLVGGIIVGSCALIVISKASPHWVRDVLHGSRGAVYGTMIMLSYPFFSIGLATILLAFGLLSAVWVATDTPIRWACSILLIAPVAVGVVFAIICIVGPTGPRLAAIEFVESGTTGGSTDSDAPVADPEDHATPGDVPAAASEDPGAPTRQQSGYGKDEVAEERPSSQ